MKQLIFRLSCCLMFFCSCAAAQVLDGNPDHVVNVMLDSKSDAIIDGIMVKQLTRMGDAASVALTRQLAGKTLTAHDVNRSIQVIELSFRDLMLVDNKQDREPRVALFVLNTLALYSKDAQQRKQIEGTAEFVVKQYDKLPGDERVRNSPTK